MKDGPEGDSLVSRLEAVEVGTDIDGDAITSCAVTPVESQITRPQKSARLPKAAQTALRSLEEAIQEQGTLPLASNHIPAGAKVVGMAVWQQQAYRRGISTSAEDRAKQTAFKRAADHLIGIARVAVWDDQVWLTS